MRTLTKTYRVSLRLDTEADADIIVWLETLPTGRRSTGLREALRVGMKVGVQDTHSGLAEEQLRRVLAEELTKLMDRGILPLLRIQSAIPSNNEIEQEYGAKLDQLLTQF